MFLIRISNNLGKVIISVYFSVDNSLDVSTCFGYRKSDLSSANKVLASVFCFFLFYIPLRKILEYRRRPGLAPYLRTYWFIFFGIYLVGIPISDVKSFKLSTYSQDSLVTTYSTQDIESCTAAQL